MENEILRLIANEIEIQYNCKVVAIGYVQLLSLCVRVKLQFKDDFIYKPFQDMPTPESICFKDKEVSFVKRVDLFKCVKNNITQN